jgi:hypothetical protein
MGRRGMIGQIANRQSPSGSLGKCSGHDAAVLRMGAHGSVVEGDKEAVGLGLFRQAPGGATARKECLGPTFGRVGSDGVHYGRGGLRLVRRVGCHDGGVVYAG